MPKFEYDPETYDNDTFEPNRVRKIDKFKREREETSPNPNIQEVSIDS